MNVDRFRLELDFYESTFANWTRFVMETCGKPVNPIRLALGENSSLWLVYQVPDGGNALKCNDGKMVRILKMGLATEQTELRH